MGRGLGRALQAAVSRDGVDADLDLEGRSLANARRRQVFRYLCLRPCARVADIGRELRMSQATVRWHAWDLVENGYLQVEGTRVFPVGLIDPEDASLFAALASPGRAAIFSAAFATPGISFQDLAARVDLTRQSVSKIATELVEFGLVTLAEDGRYRRLSSTDRLRRKRDANRAREKAFGEAFLRRVSSEGFSPELMRRDETTLLVRFGVGSRQVLFEVPLDPYTTAWNETL
jgi:DNA-binding transcriptional ArsR family regulator